MSAVVAHKGDAGAVALVLDADTGASLTTADAAPYLDASVVTDISPNVGQLGTEVTITGARLLGGGSAIDSVTFGDQVATLVTSDQDDAIDVVDVGGGIVGEAVDVVIVSDSGARTTASEGWTQLAAGEITSLTPAVGQVGTRVTIAGTNMLAGGSVAAEITLAGTAVGEIVDGSSDDEIVIVSTNAGNDVTGDVVIKSDTGSITTLAGGWGYTTAGAVDTVVPATGQLNTEVIISGSNLFGGGDSIASITLGSLSVKSISDESDDAITVIVDDAGGASNAAEDITIISNTGAITVVAGAWQYLEAGVIADVNPESGVFKTAVTITGERLHGGGSAVKSVKLAGVEVESIEAESDTSVEVIAADASDVAGDILLTTDTGATVTKAIGWTYLEAGSIATVEPSYGQLNTKVLLSGDRLLCGGTDLVSVTLAGVSDNDIVSAEDSSVTVVAAGADAAASGDAVLVADSGGQTTKSDGWTYKEAGEIPAP